MKKNSRTDRQNLRLPRLLAGLGACSCLALGACGDAELVLENWPVEEEGQFEIPAEEDAGGTPSGGIDSDAGEPGPAETADSGAGEEADAGAVVPIGADSGAGGEEDADSGEPPEADDAGGGEEEEDAGAVEEPDAGPPPPDPLAWVPACSSNCPKVIESLPYSGTGDTRQGLSLLDSYSCASDISEAGPEEVYVFHVEEPGTFVAGLTEPKNGDVDIHLLTQNSASSCLRRSDKGVSAHLEPGVYYLALDTYSSASKAGAYGLYAAFYADGSKCGMNAFDMERVNDSTPLPMPATGRVVKEAHLVTVSDQSANGGSSWWPSTGQEYLSEHKARTASLTGVSYNRTEAWAPKGEGGCEYGQGSTGKAVPDLAEAWYVCMYWKGAHKPKPGTKYLVVNPVTGKAVVAAAGYEAGPGDKDKIGGAVEEIHHELGTAHGSTLTFGELTDQSLPFGPVECD